eukprot:11330222-Prorocentrum_lima.AAC.1
MTVVAVVEEPCHSIAVVTEPGVVPWPTLESPGSLVEAVVQLVLDAEPELVLLLVGVVFVE